MQKNIALFVAVVACCAVARAQTITYPSGALRLFRLEGESAVRQSRDAALDDFARAATPPTRDSRFGWRAAETIEDATHAHRLYELEYQGRRVADYHLRAHWNRRGYVDFATSGWDLAFDVVAGGPARGEAALRRQLEEEAIAKWGRFDAEVETTPVIWVDRKAKVGVPALEVKIVSKKPFYLRHFYVDESTHEMLEEKRVFRNAAGDVYMRFPDGSGTNFTNQSGTFSGSTLSSSTNVTKRLQNFVTPAETAVDPTQSHNGLGFNTNPALYDETCTGTCPDQSFDSTNVHYHLVKYRQTLDAYFTALGVTPNLALGGSNVLNALINAFDVDSNLDGDEDEANNAFYGSLVLRSGIAVTGGLFFLRPAATSGASPICPSVQFFDLAREALVIVHENQHYYTYRITRMVSGTLTQPLVGDAFHEGFSDYFGASQVTALSGSNTTTVGEYAFQNCADLRRDISTLKVFVNSASSQAENDFSDSHIGGWTWASGLWQLRTELGVAVADKMALKSLFFFSTRPGFIEGVEALVKADQELNGGANATRIRQLYYTTLNFIGANDTSLFRDLDHFVVETGFRSCLGVATPGAGPPWVSLLAMFAWLMGLRWAGRWGRK